MGVAVLGDVSVTAGEDEGVLTLYDDGIADVNIDTNAVDSWINTGGQFGIGTSAPAFALDVSGQISATTDIRAPIFYDSANTAYFLDLASTVTSLSVPGQISASGAIQVGGVGVIGAAGDLRMNNLDAVDFDTGANGLFIIGKLGSGAVSCTTVCSNHGLACNRGVGDNGNNLEFGCTDTADSMYCWCI